jgi:RNA polymerase sigma factor (TIGR02999 family)
MTSLACSAPARTDSAIYARLRSLAAHLLRRERRDHTLQATALAHEAYVRVASGSAPPDLDRLLPVASRVMREVLVDYARRRNALKRGGRHARHPIETAYAACRSDGIDLLELDEALSRLTAIDVEAARIVEMRFFGGLTEEETAAVMGVSARTVRRGWSAARVWLARELSTD